MVREYVARCFSTYNQPQEWEMKVRAYDAKDATFQVERELERMSKRYGNEVHMLVSIGPDESEPAAHDPRCKPDFPFYLCPVCYPGL